MLRRFLLPFLLAVFLALVLAAGEAGALSPGPSLLQTPGIYTTSYGDDGIICLDHSSWNNRYACIPGVPHGVADSGVKIRLPVGRPELTVVPLRPADGSVTPLIYAQIVQEDAPVYSHPAKAAYGLPPTRRLGVGFVWVSVQGSTTYEGRQYYQINSQEYVPAAALSLQSSSTFQGVLLTEQPERPFAWILRAVQPRMTPGGDVNADAPVFGRYQLVEIHSTEHLGNEVWYQIAPDQWINQVYVGKVAPAAVPPDVGSGAAWIDINLFEQTLAAYVGDRMVYATLVSTGLSGWDTPPGLFQVWHRVQSGKMSGADNRPDYYFLEDVPWTLYFNRDIALHGAYWHDGFGYRHSHGCVNLAPLDAKWLFGWATGEVWVQVQSGQ
jgi:hypothetical protein